MTIYIVLSRVGYRAVCNRKQDFVGKASDLFDGCPDAMDVVMVVEGLEKFAYFAALLFR